MSVESDLSQIVTKLRQVETEILEAENNRIKITGHVSQNYQAWRSNPSDKNSKENFVEELDKDQVYLDIISKHLKHVKSILKIVKREFNKIGIKGDLKKRMNKIINAIIQTMNFTSEKEKAIKNKIKKWEKFADRQFSDEELDFNNHKEYAFRNFDTLVDWERFMDSNIAKMLQGTFTMDYSQWEIAKRELSGGRFGKDTGVNVPKSFMEARSEITDQHPQELHLIVQIIELILKFLQVLARDENMIANLEKAT